MKRSFFTISLLLMAGLTAGGQNGKYYEKLVAEGNRFYAEEQYSLAIDYYKDAIAVDINDPGVDYKLAESFRNTFNYPEAEVYYLKVLYTAQNSFPLSLFYYALMLKLNGNVSEAMERFDQFIAFHTQNPTLKNFVEQAIIEKAAC